MDAWPPPDPSTRLFRRRHAPDVASMLLTRTVLFTFLSVTLFGLVVAGALKALFLL